MRKVNVFDIGFDISTNSAVLILKDEDNDDGLLLGIGAMEARAILFGLNKEKITIKRPLSHDLMLNILDTSGMELLEVNITKLENNTYFANLIVEKDNSIESIDSRPSDAIALAVRRNIPITVAEEVFDKATVPLSQSTLSELDSDSISNKENFKDFVNNISPQDFAKYAQEKFSDFDNETEL